MKSILFTKLPLACGLASALLMSSCQPINQPTNITATGTLGGDNGSRTLSMTHDGVAEGGPQLIIASPSDIGNLDTLSISTRREGAAPALGYELSAIVNNFSVGGGGGFSRSEVAGDIVFHLKNTGKIAKISRYWYESPEQTRSFELPSTPSVRMPGNAWFARVRSGEQQALVPYSDTVNDRSIFFDIDCLRGGEVPCFDMATLANELFKHFSSGFDAYVEADENVGPGGPARDGNYRLDYVPSVPVQMGPCNNQRTIPGFGFVFAGSVIFGNGLASFDVSIPIIFGIDTVPEVNGRNKFKVFVLPFDVVGSPCLEPQAVGPIFVRATTPLGVGAREAADAVRKTLACGLFGSGLSTIDCPDDAPETGSMSPLLLLGIAAMVENTLLFYHRKAHSGNVTQAMSVYIRARGADNKVTTTRIVPATGEDCPNALDDRRGRPAMCIFDLMILE